MGLPPDVPSTHSNILILIASPLSLYRHGRTTSQEKSPGLGWSRRAQKEFLVRFSHWNEKQKKKVSRNPGYGKQPSTPESKFEGRHLHIPNLSPWSFDIIILDAPPIGLWVSIEDSHNCASVWQHRISRLCCQGERLLFLMAMRKLVMKYQESLKRVSVPQKSSQWPQKPGTCN